MYTCRILVCHPTVRESDLKNIMSSEENRTIAHSPPPMTGNVYKVYIYAVPFIMFRMIKCLKKIDCVNFSFIFRLSRSI